MRLGEQGKDLPSRQGVICLQTFPCKLDFGIDKFRIASRPIEDYKGIKKQLLISAYRRLVEIEITQLCFFMFENFRVGRILNAELRY